MQAAIKSFLHEIDCMMENRSEAISDVEVQPKTLRMMALDAIAVHSKDQSRLTLKKFYEKNPTKYKEKMSHETKHGRLKL